MAVFSGHTGVVSVGTYFDLFVTEWALDYTADVHDTSVMSASAVDRSFVSGVRNATGTLTGYAPDGVVLPTADEVGETVSSAVFTMGNTDDFTCNIIFTEQEWTTGIDGPDQLRASFQVTGGVTPGVNA